VAVGLAQMAATMDGLAALAPNRTEVRLRPHVQFSSDVVADVLARIEHAAVDAVLVSRVPGGDEAVTAALLAAAPCHLLAVRSAERLDPSRPVLVQTGDGVDADTAFELAARAALGRDGHPQGSAGTVVLLGDPSDEGRAGRLAERLDRLHLPGLVAERPATAGSSATGTAASESPADLLLVGLLGEGREQSIPALDELLASRSATVVAVRSGDDPRRVGMEERIRRLALSMPPARADEEPPAAAEPTSVGAPALATTIAPLSPAPPETP
jgi:hypothetical protein